MLTLGLRTLQLSMTIFFNGAVGDGCENDDQAGARGLRHAFPIPTGSFTVCGSSPCGEDRPRPQGACRSACRRCPLSPAKTIDALGPEHVHRERAGTKTLSNWAAGPLCRRHVGDVDVEAAELYTAGFGLQGVTGSRCRRWWRFPRSGSAARWWGSAGTEVVEGDRAVENPLTIGFVASRRSMPPTT